MILPDSLPYPERPATGFWMERRAFRGWEILHTIVHLEVSPHQWNSDGINRTFYFETEVANIPIKSRTTKNYFKNMYNRTPSVITVLLFFCSFISAVKCPCSPITLSFSLMFYFRLLGPDLLVTHALRTCPLPTVRCRLLYYYDYKL